MMQILLLEDEETLRQFIVRFLTLKGYRVEAYVDRIGKLP